MKIVFNTYTDKKGNPKYGYYGVLRYLEGLNDKDLVVRVDYQKKDVYSLDEEDFFFPSLKIKNLELRQIDDNGNFEASFDTKELRNVFTLLATLGMHGNPGHTYGVLIGKEDFEIDGDGSDRLVSINGVKMNIITKENRQNWSKFYNIGVEIKENNKTVIIKEKQLRGIIEEAVKKYLTQKKHDSRI